jgi:hypothetical protein
VSDWDLRAVNNDPVAVNLPMGIAEWTGALVGAAELATVAPEVADVVGIPRFGVGVPLPHPAMISRTIATLAIRHDMRTAHPLSDS